MSDNNFVEKKPLDEKEIGRVNNQLNPNTAQEKGPQEIGRMNNELNPNNDPATPQEIGRVNNELNPDPGRQGTVPPSSQEIGVVNNEKAG
jgi:hypothetical protein